MEWFDLAQDREMCQAVLDVVRNLQVSQNVGNLLIS